VRRLCRIARFGTRQPVVPDYAGAFRAIGPAAIKLGQTLATRPDLVGEEAARNLLALQDKLPPVDFALIRREIETSFERPLESLFSRFDEDPVGAASIAQVHQAWTLDGRKVAVKVLRPGVREKFARDIETYEWAAAHLEALGGEAGRLRPRLIIANFRRWTLRELDLRREAASASELADAMHAFPGYRVPGIDWDRTNGRVMTLDWIDGVKISDLEAIDAAGHDRKEMASRLVLAFLTQAISGGCSMPTCTRATCSSKPMARSPRSISASWAGSTASARLWLAEILYGLTTGDYRRVAEIHFEAQYVPSYHSVDEFATALRAVGEPMRGRPVKDLSVGQMLDGLFAITRDFDMQTQPHLLLLQKTMVMVEGIAQQLDPDINMWDTAAPFVRNWLRDELGPEAAIAERLREDTATLMRVPELIRRIEERFRPRARPRSPAPARRSADVGPPQARLGRGQDPRQRLAAPDPRGGAGRRRRARVSGPAHHDPMIAAIMTVAMAYQPRERGQRPALLPGLRLAKRHFNALDLSRLVAAFGAVLALPALLRAAGGLWLPGRPPGGDAALSPAALAVRLWPHGGQYFWAVSGFVFAHVYLADSSAMRRFWLARVARLWPLHLLTLVLVAGLRAAYTRINGTAFIYHEQDWKHFLLSLPLAQYWGWQNNQSYNGPSWSLSTEIWPMRCSGCCCRRLRRAPLSVALPVAVMVLRCSSWAGPTMGRCSPASAISSSAWRSMARRCADGCASRC
jgi:ubiquinone biosynthesis protein